MLDWTTKPVWTRWLQQFVAALTIKKPLPGDGGFNSGLREEQQPYMMWHPFINRQFANIKAISGFWQGFFTFPIRLKQCHSNHNGWVCLRMKSVPI